MNQSGPGSMQCSLHRCPSRPPLLQRNHRRQCHDQKEIPPLQIHALLLLLFAFRRKLLCEVTPSARALGRAALRARGFDRTSVRMSSPSSLIRRASAGGGSWRAPWKGGVFQWVQVPPGNRSSRKQPEQRIGTNYLTPNPGFQYQRLILDLRPCGYCSAAPRWRRRSSQAGTSRRGG